MPVPCVKQPRPVFAQDSVQGLFDKARQSGAEEGTATDLRPQVPLVPMLCCMPVNHENTGIARAVPATLSPESPHGNSPMTRAVPRCSALRRRGPERFSGTARTLGGAGGSAAEAKPPADAEPAAPEPVVHTITFYDNGIFTVDDGAGPWSPAQAVQCELHARPM